MKQFAISAILTGALSASVMASPFSDLPSSHWAYGQITALHKAGIIQGVGGNKFNGDEKISRYEAAVMVHNAIRHLNSIKSSGGKN